MTQFRQKLGSCSPIPAYLPIAFDNLVDGSTHGDPQLIPKSEDHVQAPVNPYGQSKLIVEKMLRDFAAAYGLKSISLRYFNAAGADPEGETGEDHTSETHHTPEKYRNHSHGH